MNFLFLIKSNFKKFKINSLDEKLGWRQNLKDRDLIIKKKYSNSINNHRILLNKKKIKLISSFGDSFMFIVITQVINLLGKNKFPKKIIIIL